MEVKMNGKAVLGLTKVVFIERWPSATIDKPTHKVYVNEEQSHA